MIWPFKRLSPLLPPAHVVIATFLARLKRQARSMSTDAG